MREIIISDTSCLIILSNIEALDLLQKLYSKITTTADIANEFGLALPSWVEVTEATDKHYQQILELQIDKGEASAIALAIENSGCTVILDDYKARKVATSLGIKITGTIGIIVKAKIRGIIPSVAPYVERIQKTDFRLSKDIILRALAEAGE